MELLILAILILINALFAMSEIAVVSSRKIRLQQMAEAGFGGAQSALALIQDPSRFLSTVQFGITLIGILSGAYGEAALASRLQSLLSGIPLLAPYLHEISLGLVVVGLTFASLIFGELVPKRLALHHPETIAALFARPMTMLSRAAAPFVRFLAATTEGTLRLLGVRKSDEPPVTEEEIQGLMRQGMEAGVFEQQEHALVARVFKLDDRKIPAIMTPRVDVVYLELEDDLATNLARVTETRYTRHPVCQDGWSNVIGVVSTADLLEKSLSGTPIDLRALAQPAGFVPDSVTVMDLLEHFKRNRSELALVVDEYGEIEGLVTLNDVLEALVGDLPALDDESNQEVVQRDDGSWLIDGSISLDQLRGAIGFSGDFPDEEDGGYHTVAGLVMTGLGRIPRVSDHFSLDGYRFEVVDMDQKRVDRVLVVREPDNQEKADEKEIRPRGTRSNP
jgi:putative hemolysin